MYLSRFDFVLKHVPGMKMGKMNGLSRRPDWKVGVDKDNKNQVFIKDNWIHSLQEVVIEGPKVKILEKIKKARSKDKEVVRVVEEMKKAKVKELQGNEWQIEEDLVLITRNYWWPGVTKNVRRYMEGCDLCQRMKNRTKEMVGKLKLREVPEKPYTHLTVDFITNLPVVAGKDAILVVCDRLSKMTHFVAITEGMLVEGLARLFRDNI